MLRDQLAGIAQVSSAGTRALVDHGMPAEAAQLAIARGIDPADAEAHRARWLTEGHLAEPDLILAMAREHRRSAVELAPARMRATFTVREFQRLAEQATDASLRDAAATAGADPHERFRALTAHLASLRGVVAPPVDPSDDDVIDPYRRSERTYALTGTQLDPAIAQVVRVVRVAAG